MVRAEVSHGAHRLFPCWCRFAGNLRLRVSRDGYKARSLTNAMDVGGGILWAGCASGFSVAAEKDLTQMLRVEAAKTAGLAIKTKYPIVQVSIYDTVATQNTTVELPAA